MSALLALMMGVELARSWGLETNKSWIFFGALSFCVSSAALGVAALAQNYRHQVRDRAVMHTLKTLTQEHGGQLLGPRELAAWLGHYWNGDYPIRDIVLNYPSLFRAAIRVEGVPVLIDLAPSGVSVRETDRRWWARILVEASGWKSAHLNPNHPRMARLSALGFSVAATAGGLSCRGEKKGRWKYEPQAIFDLLPDLVQIRREAQAAMGDTIESENSIFAGPIASAELRAVDKRRNRTRLVRDLFWVLIGGAMIVFLIRAKFC
ncbi:MAG: hypothetical protein DRJ42_30495 [Deltaproteobacteria bacterium]|nr:MAG: hypothetical protein DRJ42_30495 [Deltaproteobacteria bacterium]